MTARTRTLATVAAGTLALVAGVAGPVAARQGFEELTLAEIGESTVTCDFAGGTDYVDYGVADETRTVLQKVTSRVDADGRTHATVITVFDGIEYVHPTADPTTISNTGTVVALVVIDPDGALVSYRQRSTGVLADADGNVLYRGPVNFDFVVVDGDPVDAVSRGPLGPCVPGIVND